MRELGFYPSKLLISQVCSQADPERMGVVKRKDFLEIMRKMITIKKPTEADLLWDFKEPTEAALRKQPYRKTLLKDLNCETLLTFLLKQLHFAILMQLHELARPKG